MATPAPCLKKFLADATLRWPDRSRASDGILGDASHQARKSDHNLGNAADLTSDPDAGVFCGELALHLVDDPRVTYIIWNGHIFKRREPEKGWQVYRGVNPHRVHMHVSIRPESRNDMRPWPWSPAQPETQRVLRLAVPMMRGSDVLKLQKQLGEHGIVVEADGFFGYGTEKAVKQFQGKRGLIADGIVGPKTHKALKGD